MFGSSCATGCTACGPESFNYDVGNAVSSSELAILRGRSAAEEIYLHQESYRSVSEFRLQWLHMWLCCSCV